MAVECGDVSGTSKSTTSAASVGCARAPVLRLFANASEAEIAGLMRAVAQVARDLGLPETGYRMLANHGGDAHQEVPHFHIHVFGGKNLGRMIKPIDK